MECRHCGAEGTSYNPGGFYESENCDCEERIHCDKAGQIGHMQCGYCMKHNQARFLCGQTCWEKFHDR